MNARLARQMRRAAATLALEHPGSNPARIYKVLKKRYYAAVQQGANAQLWRQEVGNRVK